MCKVNTGTSKEDIRKRNIAAREWGYKTNPDDIENCKYKVNPVDVEQGYPEVLPTFENYKSEVIDEFGDFYNNWVDGYYLPDGYIYIDDLEDLVFDKLTDEDKIKIRNRLKKTAIKLK